MQHDAERSGHVKNVKASFIDNTEPLHLAQTSNWFGACMRSFQCDRTYPNPPIASRPNPSTGVRQTSVSGGPHIKPDSRRRYRNNLFAVGR